MFGGGIGAAIGAGLGLFGGPAGAAIGAGIGLLGGAGISGLSTSNQNKTIDEAKEFQRLPNKQKKIILEELSRQHLHSLLDLHRNYAIDDAEEGVHDSYEEEKEREEERKRREEFYKK